MIDSGNEPVEISVHFSPDDWTEASLDMSVSSYQDRVRAMGAPSENIVTEVDRRFDGSVDVVVWWDRRGTVLDPLTGEDVTAAYASGGSTTSPVMLTDEEGETYVEARDKPSGSRPHLVESKGRLKPVIHGGRPNRKRPAIPWPWFAILGAVVFAVVSGIDWLQGYGRQHNKRNTSSTEAF